MLIFDFDGVLMDSIDEVAVTAYNTVTGAMRIELEQIPSHIITSFRTNRYHFQAIGDVLPLMEWCIKSSLNKNPDRLTPEAYARIIAETDEPLPMRSQRFFDTRARLASEHRPQWLALNRPYQPLWQAIQNCPSTSC